MEKFAIDYTKLVPTVAGPKRFPLDAVKNKIRKVAFDVVRFMDSEGIDGLWQIQKMEDGKEYILAMYESPVTEKTSTDWNVIVDKNSNASIFYKGTPVMKVDLLSVGIDSKDIESVGDILPEKLKTNTKLAASLLKSLPHNVKENLIKVHPELGQLV